MCFNAQLHQLGNANLCSPSYRPLVSVQVPVWLLLLLEPAQQEAPSELELPLAPDDVERSTAWLLLAKLAEAEARLSPLGL